MLPRTKEKCNGGVDAGAATGSFDRLVTDAVEKLPALDPWGPLLLAQEGNWWVMAVGSTLAALPWPLDLAVGKCKQTRWSVKAGKGNSDRENRMLMDENRVQDEILEVDAAVPIEGRRCWGPLRSRNTAQWEQQKNVRKSPKETGRTGQNPHGTGREVMAERFWGCSLEVERKSVI